MTNVEPGVRVGVVPYGRGVFAERRFRKGQTIARVGGRVVDDPDYASAYCIDLGGPYSLDPDEPFRCLNHSCSPNCELWVLEPDDPEPAGRPGEVVIQATRTIRPGDELTIDYAWPWECAIPCLCGSDACRGWVVDPAQLHHLRTPRRSRRRVAR